MSQAFKYLAEGTAESTKVKLIEILAKEITKPYVKTSWSQNDLHIKIEKMGTSEIQIKLTDNNGKCSIEESKRAIAFMHKAFIGEVEKMVDDLLTNKLGAKRV